MDRQQIDAAFDGILAELRWRGLIAQATDEDALDAHLRSGPITFYCGFDPTAASLHIGSLVQLLTIRRLQLAGHRPLVLVGGSTGLIGDPRPSSERSLNPRDQVAEWVRALQAQVGRFVALDGDNPATLVNNLDWTAGLSAIDFLRDVGKHFRVGSMLKKDAVAVRLGSDAGISYTEFSYQILQGYDFLQLHRQYGCTVQQGGSDQWGNLVSGIDLIRRVDGASVHAFGTPLIQNSDGSKFSKSEGTAIWLDASLTTPYAMFQFWLNSADADVVERLKVFTFLTRADIERLASAVATRPGSRDAQRALAWEVTAIVHGDTAADAARDAALALFGGGDLDGLDVTTLTAAMEGLPRASGAVGDPVAPLLVESGLTGSLGEARRAIGQGGVYVNNRRVENADAVLETMLHGRFAVLRRGRRTLAAVISGGRGEDVHVPLMGDTPGPGRLAQPPVAP